MKPSKNVSLKKLTNREKKKLKRPEILATISIKRAMMKHPIMSKVMAFFGFKKAKEIVEKVSDITTNIAAQLASVTPVDTGYMRGNWNVKVSGNKITIGNNMMYAKFVVFGTRKMKANQALKSKLKLLEMQFKDKDIYK